MSESIGAVTPVDQVAEPIQIDDVTNETSRNIGIRNTMSEVLSDAIERASILPGQQGAAATERVELTDPIAGEFGAEKAELLSDVERAGAEKGATNDASEVEIATESLRSLMSELTTWHVTWGIAQSSQKDITHVLKS